MTVTTSVSRVSYTGNGVTVFFSVPFPFIQEDYLTLVLLNTTTLAETTLVLNSGGALGYTVSGAGEAVGSVTLVTAPTGSEILTILRSVPATQEADFVANDPFPAEVFEDGLDKLTMIVGQAVSDVDRALKLFDGDVDGLGRYDANSNRIVQLADGVDPSDAATVGQLIGAGSGNFIAAGTGAVTRTMQNKARDVVAAADFGATGNGVTDDTVALQAAFDYIESIGHGTLHLSNGATYICGTLRQPGGLILEMNGATIKANASLGASAALMFNKTTTGAVNATFDDDITIRNGRFLCEITADRNVELVSFIKCGNVCIENVRVEGPRYIGMAFGGCKGVWIDGFKATGTGRVAVTAEGGAALWIGPAGDGSESDDVWVIAPKINDCEWSGIYATGSSVVNVVAPVIRDVKEAGIFGTVDRFKVHGGLISGVTKKNISAAGLELGGSNIEIGGGLLIEECDNVAVSLTDTQQVNINGFTTKNCRRDAASFPTAGHISILSLTASTGQPMDITITGHRAFDTSSPSSSAVSVAGQAPGGAVINVMIFGNNYIGTTWGSGKAIDIDRTYWTDASCEYRNNLGSDDFAPATVAVQGTTPQTLTTAVAAAVIFDAAPINSDAQWVVGSPTRITVYRAGRYRVTGQVAFVGNATGIRRANVFKNGAGFAGSGRTIAVNGGAGFTHNVNLESAVIECVAGDYFELFAEQTSGGNLDTVAGSGQTWLSVQRL